MENEYKLTFLARFIAEKGETYREPERKGTPKGDFIGFSLKKYRASLLSLLNMPLGELAQQVGVSYGLLRKWRTEERFMDQLEKHERDFVDMLLQRLKSRAERQDTLMDNHLARPLQEVAKTPPPILSWDEFRDIALYSPSLKLLIAGRLMAEAKVQEEVAEGRISIFDLDMNFQMQVYGLFDLMRLSFASTQERKSERDQDVEAINKSIVGLRLAAIRIILELSKEITEEDRKRIITDTYIIANKWTTVE